MRVSHRPGKSRRGLQGHANPVLISASVELEEERAARLSSAARIVSAERNRLGTRDKVPDACAIVSIVTDLRHLCDHKGILFKEILKRAETLYLEDRADIFS